MSTAHWSLWIYNLFDCRQLLHLTSRLAASMSGLANLFNHHSVWSICNHHFGGLDYCPHGSLATADTRSSVYSSYTLRPSNRHYFPSKPFSPSSQYDTLGRRNLTCGVQWPFELSYKAAASTNTHVPRVLNAFCKTWDWPALGELAHFWTLPNLTRIPVLPSHRTSRTPRFRESNSSILVGYYRFTMVIIWQFLCRLHNLA